MIVAEMFAKLGLIPDKKSWEKGHDLVKGMHAALAGFVGFKALQSISNMVAEVMHAGGRLDDLAQSTGVSAEALQELGFAAQENGSNMEALAGSMKKLGKGMEEAASTGKGPVVDALKSLGISMRELKGETLDQNIEVIADKIAKMPDGAKKASIAMQLFGKSGADLIPLLNQGQEGIVKFRNEARELGAVIADGDVKQLADLGDDVDRVKAALGGLRDDVVVAMLPTIREMVTGLLAWIKANRELVKSTIMGAVKALVFVMQNLAKVGLVVAKVIEFFTEHADVARAVLIALGAVIAATAASAIGTWVAAAAAFALPIAGITALILILQDVWESFTTGQGITALVVKFIGDQFGKLWRGIKGVADRVGNFFKSVGRGIKNFFIDVINFVIGKINTVIDGINWVVKQANKVPGVNLGKVGHIDSFQRDNGPTASGPTAFAAPVRAGSGVGRVENNYGDIHIQTAPGTDNEAFAAIVRKELSTHWSDRMNEALAGTGVA